MTNGEKIKAMREQKQMSQEELALKVGKAGRTYIYRIENGLKNPSFPILEEIAKALDCELEINFKKKNS